MNVFNQAYGEDGSILQSLKKLNSWDISTQRCFFHFWPVSSSSQCCLPHLERFSYDLEMKTREQNRNKNERKHSDLIGLAKGHNMPENFLEINRYFALTSYCNTIGQSNNAFSILGFSLAGKRRVHVLIFSSIG